jgi:hypothetical protein
MVVLLELFRMEPARGGEAGRLSTMKVDSSRV